MVTESTTQRNSFEACTILGLVICEKYQYICYTASENRWRGRLPATSSWNFPVIIVFNVITPGHQPVLTVTTASFMTPLDRLEQAAISQ